MADGGSAIPRRQLGRQLRALREHAGLKAESVADDLGWHRSKIWRIETGQAPVKKSDVMVLSQVLDVAPTMREVLIALAAESRNRGWWHSYGDALPEWFEMYVNFENAAARMRHYEAGVIPGLLQTDEYCRAVYDAASPDGDQTEVDRQVRLRMDRQSLLTREDPPAPQFDLVLDEAVLRRPIGGREVMHKQLDRLIRSTDLPNVTVRILPLSAGAHAGLDGTFVLLDFPEHYGEPDLVYLETATGALYLEKQKELARYEFILRDIKQRSLGVDESRDLIAAVVKEL